MGEHYLEEHHLAPPATHNPKAPLVIEAGKSNQTYFVDLWRFRELFMFLAWRDISVRYKQTVIGVAWALIRPLTTMLVMSFSFGTLANLKADEQIPYHLLTLSAILPWQLFSTSVSSASQSMVANARLVSKIYFPRVIIPAGVMAVNFVDFVISLGVLVLLVFMAGMVIPLTALMLPVLIVFTIILALGISLWLAALNVTYRDFRYLVPFILQFGLFLSPVGYSTHRVVERVPELLFVYSLNPVVWIIDFFRFSVFHLPVEADWAALPFAAGFTVVLLITGFWYFRKMERSFADVI